MNKKIKRVRENIRKAEKNINELEEYLKTLRLQEKLLEDEEIVRQIRSMNSKNGDVLDVLYRINENQLDENTSPEDEGEDDAYGF